MKVFVVVVHVWNGIFSQRKTYFLLIFLKSSFTHEKEKTTFSGDFFFLFALFIKTFSPWNCFILAIVGRKGWIMSSLPPQGFCNHADYIKSVLLAESFTFRFVKEFLSSTYRTAALSLWWHFETFIILAEMWKTKPTLWK